MISTDNGYVCSDDTLSTALQFHYNQARIYFDEHGEEPLKLRAVITKLFETIPEEDMKKQINYAPLEDVLVAVDLAINDYRVDSKKIGSWTRA